jgi:hypothetical protein
MNINHEAYKCSPEQLKEFFGFIQKGLEGVVSEHPDGVAPVLFVLCKEAFADESTKPEVRIHLLAGDFNSKLGKKQAMKTVAASIYDVKLIPMAVGLVSEAWISMPKADEYDEYRKKYLMVADDPDKKEVALVSILTNMEGKALVDCRELRRDSEDRVSWSGDWLMGATEGGTAEAYLLEEFYRAFYNFGTKQEDYRAYLDGAIVQELERGSMRH